MACSMLSNRFNIVGDFAAYMPKPKTVESLVKDALRLPSGAAPRESTTLRTLDGFRLVRYRHRSHELSNDAMALQDQRPVFWEASLLDKVACFGVIDPTDTPVVLIDVVCDPEPEIAFVTLHPTQAIPAPVMLAVLRALDVPASWRAGADHQLAERFDLWYGKEHDGWAIENARWFIAVQMTRTCFSTRPVLRETTDILVAIHPDQDIDAVDADAAYWAKDYYRHAAFEAMPSHAMTTRPGFSSWGPSQDPVRVKVVGQALDRALPLG